MLFMTNILFCVLQNRLVQYLVDTRHMHNTYSFGYFFCEILNFVNVVSIYNLMLYDKVLICSF